MRILFIRNSRSGAAAVASPIDAWISAAAACVVSLRWAEAG
jgi:hypothetical protein